jgi:hypothetical protein
MKPSSPSASKDSGPTPRPEGPDFVCIGVPKSGTSRIAQCIAQHPQVFISKKKEVGFFTRYFARGYGWYHEQFREKGSRLAGDLTTSYFITPRDRSWKKEFYPRFNPRRLFAIWERLPSVRDELFVKYPGIKIFVIFRDPADRAWSYYWHWRKRKDKLGKHVVPFEKMFEDDGRWIRSTGYYDLYLENWLELFPDMGIFLFDDLKKDEPGFFKKLAAFLGVDESFTPSFEASINKGKYNPLPPELRRTMVDEYRPHVRRLASMIGRDLSSWLRS